MSAKSDENIIVIDGRRVRINNDGSVTQLDGDVIGKVPNDNANQDELTNEDKQKSAESFKKAKEKLRLKVQAGLSLSMAKDKENF